MKHFGFRLIAILSLFVWLVTSVTTAQEAPPDDLVELLAGRDYHVAASVSNPSPYVGEQIIYILRYYAFFLPEDPYPYNLPSFEGFWLGNTIESADARIETIGTRQFFVGEAVAEITPLSVGPLEIEPALFEVSDSVFREGVRLQSERVQLDVRALPTDAPATFDSAVGQFDASLQVEPGEVVLGEPATVTMTVDGSGNLELLPVPQMPDTFGWRVYPSSPPEYNTVNLTGLPFGQKVFSWLLVAEQAGTNTYSIPAFTYFDPRSGSYTNIEFPEVVVNVLPGADGQQALIRAEARTEQGNLLPLRTVSGHLEGAETADNNILFALAWVLPPLLASIVGAWQFERVVRQKRRTLRRKQKAMQRALKRLDQVDLTQPTSASYQIMALLCAYIGDKTELPNPQAKEVNLSAFVQSERFEAAETEQLLERVQAIESLRYMPPVTSSTMHEVKSHVRDMLHLMETAMTREQIVSEE